MWRSGAGCAAIVRGSDQSANRVSYVQCRVPGGRRFACRPRPKATLSPRSLLEVRADTARASLRRRGTREWRRAKKPSAAVSAARMKPRNTYLLIKVGEDVGRGDPRIEPRRVERAGLTGCKEESYRFPAIDNSPTLNPQPSVGRRGESRSPGIHCRRARTLQATRQDRACNVV